MDLGSIFLILALALLVAIFISRPFYDKKFKNAPAIDADGNSLENKLSSSDLGKTRSSLLAEHDRLLNALQELEFDQSLGKIPAEDYPEQRMFLLQSGASILKKLDEIDEAVIIEPAEERMEAEAARISLAGRGTSSTSQEQDELEKLIAERRIKRQEKSSGFCPKCGKPVQVSDEFCPRCGKRL
jgi:hypothetical protein